MQKSNEPTNGRDWQNPPEWATIADCPYCANPNEQARPVTREAFADMECPDPNCTCSVLSLSPDCHPVAGLLTFYCKRHGTLALFCAECNHLQAVVAVAREPRGAAKGKRRP